MHQHVVSDPKTLSVYAMNGKSVEIDNTDAEGRLVLSGKMSRSEFLLLSSLFNV